MALTHIKNKIILNLIDELARDGERAINIAFHQRDFTNRTWNLHDSYGSAVYVNGILQRYTIRFVEPETAKVEISSERDYLGERTRENRRGMRWLHKDTLSLHGREEIDRFFIDYKPEGRGIQLVIVAAMFYASILENGRMGNIHRKYKVISGANSYMQMLAKKYHASLYRLNIWRDLDRYGSGSFTIRGKQKLV